MVVDRKRYGIKSSMMQLSYLSEARGNLGMQNGNTKSASCYTRLQKTVADETADAFPISTEIPRVHCFQRRSPVCLDLGWIWSPGDCIRRPRAQRDSCCLLNNNLPWGRSNFEIVDEV